MRSEAGPPEFLYVVDSCSFIELRRTYPRPQFDAVWKLVERLVRKGLIVSIEEVLVELDAQDDSVARWAHERENIFLPLSEDVQNLARDILAEYPTLVDLKKKRSSADPFLIALGILIGGIVVTEEKRSGGPPAVKIPDVCAAVGVPCIPLLEMLITEQLET